MELTDVLAEADTNSQLSGQEHIYEKIYEFTSMTNSSTSSLLWEFISNFRIGMDITAISCPAFLLRPISMLEVCSEAIAPLDDLSTISTLDTPIARMKCMVKSMLSCCCLVPRTNINNCKPYNPILAERFQCTWEHEDGSKSNFRAEQVSHHPPISACHIKNEKANIQGLFVTKPGSYFRGNYVEVDLLGKYIMSVTNVGEDYEVTFPTVWVNGIVWGRCCIEHGKTWTVKCKKSGINTLIEFVSGNTLRGEIMYADQKLSFSGDVFGTISFDDGEVLYDYNTKKKPKKFVRPVVEQDELESRRVWHHASYALIKGENDQAHKAKHEVEERQRELRKNGIVLPLTWFKSVGESINNIPQYEYIGPQ